MDCHPVAVIIMHVHKYGIKIKITFIISYMFLKSQCFKTFKD